LSRFVLMRKLTMLIATIAATATTMATAAIKIHSQVGITGSFFLTYVYPSGHGANVIL
jgi:hypothetical protein